ncbi:MAG: beta strand repeat-containing protein [Verrucomicrobiota bacterium]
MKKLICRKYRSWWKDLALTACSIAACVPAMAQLVIPVVDFDLDTVGTQSSNPNIVHSTIADWTVVTDSVLDPAAPENVYESTQDQTNIKIEFPSTTLAPGETLRVKVDYKYVATPTSPGIQQYNFLRFGAYQTFGTATFTDDIGYLADVSYWQQGSGAKSGDYSIRREDNVWDDFDLGPLLDNQVSPVAFTPPAVPETGDIVTMFQPDGMMANWPKPFDDGVTSDHAAVICVSNTGTAVEVCLYHGFPPTLIGKAVDSSAAPIVTFDTVYLESPSDNNGFHVDNIGIQHIAPELACCSGCVEFQDLTLGSVYNVGDTFTVHSADGSFGFDVVASDFFFSSGSAFSGGFAEVENGGLAGYYGHEMEVNNINLEFTPTGASPMGLSVMFGEYGGNINLSVNGVAANVANFIDLDGLTLGGAMLSVPTGGLGNDTGELRMTGAPITQFIIGGQELWIDHICEYDEQMPPSNCPIDDYIAHDNGLPGGGEPDPVAAGWTYPNSATEQANFLADLASLGISTDIITFEGSNGWSPVNGTGDLFAGSGAPYAGGPYTSAAFGTSGEMATGDAVGSVSYNGADNTVRFTLFNNGHAAGIDEPGIGDMDGSNDSDRGINTTPGGFHFLEALPSENLPGGLAIEFDKAVPAVGMYVMGVEENKRDIEVTILHADGSMQVRPADIVPGPLNDGGTQFLGYLAPDLQDSTCWIKRVTFNELYDGEPAGERDIFSIDDVIYVASEANPELDPEIPDDPNNPNNPGNPGDPNDPQNNPNPQLVFGNPTPNLLNKGVASFPVAFENVSAVLLDLDDIKVLASGSVTFDPTLVLNINGTDHAVEITITGGDGTLAIEIPTDVAFDAAGNSAPAGTSPTVAVDNTPPALTIGVPDIDVASRAIQWPLEYQGATEVNLLPGMITAVVGNTNLGTLAVNGGDSLNPSVRLESFPSGVTGDLVLTIAPGGAKDAANNTDTGGTQSLAITDLTFADKSNANDPDNVDLTNKLFALGGKLQDGYISGALVFFDENRNGQHDNGEPSTFTNNQGAFQLAIDLSQYDDNNNNVLDPSEGVLIMQGGVDISTGLAFEGQFLAPVGASLATPLSSLIVAIVDLNPTFTFAQAQTSIKQGLNLSGSVNINTYDPIASAAQGDGASGQVFAAAAMVQDTVFTMTRILNTAGGGNQLGTIQAAGYRYIANRLMLNQPVTLTDADFLKTMIASLQQSLNIAVDATVVDAWANSVANSNQLKQKAADSNNPADAVKQIAKTQLVTQSQLTDDLANVQSGKVDADELQATYSGNGLENAVNQAPVGDVFANENRIGTFSFSKATYNQYEGPVASGGAQKISVDSITIKREDGNQQTVTLIVTPTDGTATTANGDFLANTVEVTFADTEIYKTVSLANIIQDDAAVEGDETMNLQLTLKPGSPANAQFGAQTTATVNILDNDASGTFAFATAQGNVIEGDEASRQVVIERTQGLGGQVVLDISVAALQGATAGSDFNNAAMQVTFPAGTSKKVVLLPVIDDLVLAEPNETFQLTLAIGAGSAPGAVLGAQNTFTATIVDNDVATQVNVTSSNPSVTQTRNGPVTVDLQYAGAASVDVRLSDITLVKTGTATGRVTMTGGTTATPKVTVSNITGDGTLAIQVAAGRGLDALGNGDAGVTSSTFTVDNTGPAISIGNPSASVTLNGPVSFPVTYANDAFAVNLKASQVTVEGGLNVKADIQITNATTRNPTVTLSNITGMWNPYIRIAGGSAQDLLGNNDQGAVSAGFEILGEAPNLSVGIPSTIATREGPVTIPLSYQGVSKVALSPDDVELIQTGSATGTVSVEDGNSSTPRIIISGISGTGTLAVRVKSGSGQNQLGITDSGGESRSIQIDNSAPVMSVSTLTTLTNGSEALVDVRYDGAYLIVLRKEYIALQYDGAVTAEFELLEVDANTRRVRLFNIQGNGAIRVNVAPGRALSRTGIHENQGGSSEWIRIDQTAPTVAFFNVQEVNVNGGMLIYGVQYHGAENINLNNDHIRLITTGNTQASASVQTVPGNTNQRQIVVNNIQGDGTLQVEVSAGSASDQAGNVDQTALLSPLATIDQTGPTVAIGDPSSLATQGEMISIPLTVQGGTFSDLNAGHIQLVLTGESLKAGVDLEKTSDTEAVITLSGFEGEGTISLGVTAGAAKDAAGNESADIAATWSIQVTQPAPKAEPGKLGIQGSTLSLFGTEGVVYLLEVTTNFVDWELVSELKATGNETALTFDLDISSGAGFYRVRTVEP